jgi:hypothetical protein
LFVPVALSCAANREKDRRNSAKKREKKKKDHTVEGKEKRRNRIR